MVAKDADGRWLYGTAGDIYQVKEGDIWQVGPHILACGDLEKGHALSLLQQVPAPDMVMCDPPWDAGNAHAFRTKAGLSRPVDFTSLMNALLSCGSLVKGYWFFEMGNRNTSLVQSLIRQQGGRNLHEWDTYYYRIKPCKFLCFTWNPDLKILDGSSPAGMDEPYSFAWAIERGCAQGEHILDLCIGRGLTARIAHQQDKHVIGLELNPRRLAVTIDWLVQQGMTAKKTSYRLS